MLKTKENLFITSIKYVDKHKVILSKQEKKNKIAGKNQ